MTVLAGHAAPGAVTPRPAGSRRRAARIAGASYLVMFALAVFANFVVLERLVVPGDADTTMSNITGSLGLFRLGVGAFLAIFVLDIVIAWALHVVFRDVDRDLSLAAAWLRLVYSGILGVAVAALVDVLRVVGGTAVDGPLPADRVSGEAMRSLDSFESLWMVGLAVFGLHLAVVGWLAIRSGLVSRALGVILVVAGAAYLADTLAQVLFGGYPDVASIFLAVVAVPSMVGEGWLAFWLLRARAMDR